MAPASTLLTSSEALRIRPRHFGSAWTTTCVEVARLNSTSGLSDLTEGRHGLLQSDEGHPCLGRCDVYETARLV